MGYGRWVVGLYAGDMVNVHYSERREQKRRAVIDIIMYANIFEARHSIT
jgi:hypothetical protein